MAQQAAWMAALVCCCVSNRDYVGTRAVGSLELCLSSFLCATRKVRTFWQSATACQADGWPSFRVSAASTLSRLA
jgi:hypothetical protein